MPRNKPDNLENEITPTKNADINILSTRITTMEQRILFLEKDLNVSSQRMRENTIEFTGVPDSIQDEFLEAKCIEMVEKIGINVLENEIQGIHRLP